MDETRRGKIATGRSTLAPGLPKGWHTMPVCEGRWLFRREGEEFEDRRGLGRLWSGRRGDARQAGADCVVDDVEPAPVPLSAHEFGRAAGDDDRSRGVDNLPIGTQ